MTDKLKYSSEELAEFKAIIEEKLERAQTELKDFTDAINNIEAQSNTLSEEDTSVVEQREQLNELASRQYKFIKHLEEAMTRIQRGTYGICVVTGKLISKERLRVVPHTNHSKEAKEKKRELV